MAPIKTERKFGNICWRKTLAFLLRCLPPYFFYWTDSEQTPRNRGSGTDCPESFSSKMYDLLQVAVVLEVFKALTALTPPDPADCLSCPFPSPIPLRPPRLAF